MHDENSIPNLYTVKQFIYKHNAFTYGSIRSIIFYEHKNGLKESGAILRIGRKILIDEKNSLNGLWKINNV